MSIPFVKMQGLGNDFVLIDDVGKPWGFCQKIDAELARAICDRRYGIGADQLLWLKSPQDPRAQARMEILNADGSVAEMCGNGIRAVGVYLDRLGTPQQQTLSARYLIETLAGILPIEVQGDRVSVEMGLPQLGPGFETDGEVLRLADGLGVQVFRFFEVNMGNPHAVIFSEGPEDPVVLQKWGSQIETHPRFVDRTNVEWVEVLGPSSIRVRVWERGAGMTLACGTGACAAAVAAIQTGRVSSPIAVTLPGGTLEVSWNPGASVVMKGPAELVFRGEYFVGNSL
ncbi:diaminopimelate epimerase [Bdellovibrionota bacterium FG-1]